ncbi:MAG: hypothetical protein ACD_32C00111G0003 [uncultured bacterium]|uniref:Glycosyltransferase RgtA/B/C/D-like domain-containing protein n=1 Tax=Candidatus Daviesbacteria bacterium GW2011_GWC2_40_12 TaxID=1618431 RepID=A0A0G0TXD7_9BACT|nr:MAG: hypothetical protein ACD_32C00111G0003 [uncultured bacterium]KKR17223.1 MAG: hypothetical protein UT45_C0002G0052 [Candidatus Daviesbacteria bacterium GW2011_GWA2_39_33]KKR42622.1 MAG: hypothetical protein UT77_C0001G0073 [Candidatus Daviesbacteria bacterium GW2011_GWC2_40_12]OGE21298.1 MAG: hypothetical protein A2778_03975 [Candidatus Daviesbacteria bacterium RIFCSPHIGHO2_01_FULL_40_24]OGE30184.1 MAG: hypothetical protein A3C29_02145 [Candidatus Daviesbacteria bacterium RIFCSPHIGHO2_02
MNIKILVGFIVILFIAFVLRFYNFTLVPPSLNWDEVSIGYNAYSILKSGKDEWNQFLPLHFKSYGEYKLPAQVYISIPGIYLFGLNEFGVRITPVIYGTVTVFIMFFLGRNLFGNNFVGFISAFLLAISPWHIQLTRASFESSLATLFVTLGIWFFVKGFKKQIWFVYSMIPFAISVFTYNSARIFAPVFLIALFLIYRKDLIRFKKFVILAIVIFVILLLPLTPYLLSGERSARYKLVSITDDPGLVLRINENRGKTNLPEPLPKVVHNKITYTGIAFAKNFLAHFSPEFLFISGAPHKQHHAQRIGQLYYFQAVFLLIGLIGLFKLKQKFKGLLLSWVLLAFLPVSVTNDSIPHALRTLIAAPFFQLITAFGMLIVSVWLRNRSILWKGSVILVVLIIFVLQFVSYINNYYQVYPKLYSRDWQYGYKQVVEYIKNHYFEYDQIIFTRHYGEPHMFTLFNLNYDPAKYQNDPNLMRFETHDWVRVLRFDKFYFPDLGDEGTRFVDIVSENPSKKLLFIGRAVDFPKEVPRIFSIDFLDGERAFDIVQVK